MTDFLTTSAPPPSAPRLPSHSFLALSASAALAAPAGSAAAAYKVPRAAFFPKTPPPSATPFVSPRSGARLFTSASVASKRADTADAFACDDVLKLRLADIAPSALAGQVPCVAGVAEFRVLAGAEKGGREAPRLAVPAQDYVLRLLADVRALQAAKAEAERRLAREMRVGERSNRRLAERVKEGEAEAAAMRVEARRGEEVRAAQKADASAARGRRSRGGRMWECVVARSEVGSSVSGSDGVECRAVVAMGGVDVGRAKAFSQVGKAWESKEWIADCGSAVTDGAGEEGGKV